MKYRSGLHRGFWSELNHLAVRGSSGAWDHGVNHKGVFSKALCAISEEYLNITPSKTIGQ